MADIYIQPKPQLDYSILYKTRRKELVTKTTYFILAFAYMFISALLQPQQTKTIKGLPLEPRNQKEAMNLVSKKEWKAIVDKEQES